MFIGSRLKGLRKQKNLTQEALGKLINVTKVSICGYETNERTPSLETLDDLANVFGVDANYFLGKDIPVVNESSPSYTYYASKEEITFLKQIRLNKKIYNKILEDPKRMADLIDMKLK